MSQELIKPLLTSKQERFCQLIATGGKSQTDCYLEAYPNTVMRKTSAGVEATRMLKMPEIVARVREIRAPAVAKAQKKITYEIEHAFKELEEAYQLARALMDPKGMKSIIELKARLAGLVVNISEKRTENPLGDVTTEDLMEMRAQLKRQKMQDAGEPLLKVVDK